MTRPTTRTRLNVEQLEERQLLSANLGSDPTLLFQINDVSYYAATGQNSTGSDVGRELFRSDGTSSGTKLVKDIRPGDDGSGIKPLDDDLDLFRGKFFFTANDGT